MTCNATDVDPRLLHRIDLGSRTLWFNPLTLRKVVTAHGTLPDRSMGYDIYAAATAPPPPQGVTHYCLVVTNRCNLACEYCAYAASRTTARDDMGMDVAEEAIAEIEASHRPVYVTMLGGEPLMNWDVVRRVCESIAAPKVIYTNATRLDDDKIALLVRTGTSIIVSIDGPDLSGNRRRYRVADQFDETRAAVRRLAELEVPYGISAVFDPAGAADGWQGLLDMVDAYRPVSLAINRLYYNDRVDMCEEDGRLFADCLLRLQGPLAERGVYFESIDRYIQPLVEEEPRLFYCTAQCGRKTIFPDGSWHPCQFDTLEFDYPGRFDAYATMNPRHDPECTACEARGLCGGGCSMSRRQLGRTGPMPEHCEFMRYLLDGLLRQMADGVSDGPLPPEALRGRYYPRAIGGDLDYSVGHSVRTA